MMMGNDHTIDGNKEFNEQFEANKVDIPTLAAPKSAVAGTVLVH
jgi:hypothetical protein